jgi:putative membrane protein
MKMKHGMSRGLVIATLAIAALGLRAQESDSTKSATTRTGAGATDKETVIKESAKMNMAVTKYADLAMEKAQSPELKQYAQTLKQDHQKAQQDLEKIAQKHNVTLPTSVDEKCKEELSRLEAVSDQQFDKEFAKGAVEGHAMAVAHLQQASSSAQDTDIRQYTQQMLSKVKEHQRKGREIAKSVGIDQTTITSLETKAQQEAVGGPASSETSSQTPKSSTDSSNQPTDPEKKSDN